MPGLLKYNKMVVDGAISGLIDICLKSVVPD